VQPVVESFYDKATSTISHVVVEPNGRRCAIVDSVLDYDHASGRTRTDSADRIIANVRDRGLEVDWILETHAHADHLSAAQYLRRELGGRIGIGARIIEVQRIFKDIFNLERTFNTDGQQFDHLFADGEVFHIGRQEARVVCTPGHTPADVTNVVGDAAFVGDTLFMPDGGTARADFPGGDAATLYRSIRRILDLPPETRLFVCHDYQPGGREPRWETTVAEQRERNIHVGDGKDEGEFVSMRTARDRTLSTPTLLIPSIQINIRAGEMPPPEDNGTAYIKVPINRL
jgi:glyoxylase-like metal-dependent hydrolase (beta-lactamase superfamily II)